MRTVFTFLIAAMSLLTANAQYSDTLSIKGFRGKLFAIVQTPDRITKTSKYPLVIVCHGFGGNCQGPLITDIADDVVAKGMASLRFDFNGHGRSEGLFQDMTVPNEIEDLKSVISWAKKQSWVESVCLVGHSQGGVVVSMVAGELGDKEIKAEVLLAPAAVLRDDALRGNTMGAIYDPWNITGDYVQLPFGGLRLGKDYIRQAVSLPIYETAAGYHGPALIIHGMHDRVVPYTYAERYHEKIKDSALKIIPDEDHGFSGDTAATALMTADWLQAVLE